MLPLIEAEIVDKRKWLDRDDFIDLFAVTQSLPGVFAVNISIFIGYRLKGNVGAIFCALGTILPSFSVILLVAMFFVQLRENPIVIRIFNGIRPAVVAMIAAPVISTWRKMSTPNIALWIPILTAILVWYFGVSPVLVIIASAILGMIYVFFVQNRIKKNDRQ